MAKPAVKRKARTNPHGLSSLRKTLVLASARPKVDVLPILDRISDAFGAIGKTAKTTIPAGTLNTAKEAAEFAVAKRLAILAEARLAQATAEAVKVGILKPLDSYDIGRHLAYVCEAFDIKVTEDAPTKIVDRGLLENELLVALGYAKARWIIDRCLKKRDGNTTVTVHYKG